MNERTTFGSLELDTRAALSDGGIPCILSSDTPVDRGGFQEILDHGPNSVDMSRCAQGLPLLKFHDQTLPIGRIESIQTDGHRLRGVARFGSSPEAQQAKDDALSGICSAVSVGYRVVASTEEPNNVVRVTQWIPFEASIVPVPADLNAGLNRSQNNLGKGYLMMETRTEILDLAKRHAVPGSIVDGLLSEGASLDRAREVMMEYIARRDEGGTRPRMPYSGFLAPSGVDPVIANALDARLGIRGARGDSRSLIELAAACLEYARVPNVRSMSRNEIATRALTTSDFPALLADSAGRALAQAYGAVPSPLKALARQVLVPDFRNRSVVRVGAAPELEKVNEHGEYNYSYISEAAAAWRLSTYGRILALSRQAVINDDLGGFADLINKFGGAAARKEGDLLAALILSNPTIDGTALFHASRGTLLTGGGSALASAGIAAAVKALRLQKEVDGGFIQQTPEFLLVPAALEATARQAVFAIAPAVTTNANPIEQTLKVIVEPRLDAASTTAWYLVATGASNSLEYGYLEGNEGVYVETRNGFDVDGIEVKARLDFGCGFVAPTGWIKSAGA